MARGGRVLASGAPEDPAQVVDGRDLADFQLGPATGQIDAVRFSLPWAELLNITAATAPAGTTLTGWMRSGSPGRT